MEVLANTEYQDVYRVTDGVLLIVNKFVNIYVDENVISYYEGAKKNCKRKAYHKGTKDLFIQQFDDVSWSGKSIPEGTVLYNRVPVVTTDDKYSWNYQIKTTGECFSGDIKRIESMISDILYTIRTGNTK